MNKTEIINCIHSSIAQIERELSDRELEYVREEIRYEKIQPVESLEKLINEPGIKYHEALKMANEYTFKYHEAVRKLRMNFKREGRT